MPKHRRRHRRTLRIDALIRWASAVMAVGVAILVLAMLALESHTYRPPLVTVDTSHSSAQRPAQSAVATKVGSRTAKVANRTSRGAKRPTLRDRSQRAVQLYLRSAGTSPRERWTPELGRLIADRAIAWLNWPYSFGAGDAAGPTYGFAVDTPSRNDGRARGFDCSGLVLYALAPWRSVTHLASAQYREAGSFHPTLKELMPGDLVFWSKDGTVAGIGHVAIYIGDGLVVQAPYSGSRIVITALNRVEPGSIGLTRPLT